MVTTVLVNGEPDEQHCHPINHGARIGRRHGYRHSSSCLRRFHDVDVCHQHYRRSIGMGDVARDVGHVPQLEVPEWTAGRILEWLETDVPGTGVQVKPAHS